VDYKFTTQQMATLLGVSKTTVISWAKKGDIKASEKTEDGKFFFSLNDAKENIEAKRKRVPITITFANIKGGVGKTFVAINVAATLDLLGYKTLVVDSDKQGNISEFFLGEIPLPHHPSIINVFLDEEPVGVIRNTRHRNIDIIPANPRFGEVTRFQNIEAYIKLKKFLDRVKDSYDFIVIDTPPDILLPVEASLVASDVVFVVINPEKWSIIGIDYLKKLVKNVNEAYEKHLEIKGCVFNMVDERRVIDKEILALTSDKLKNIAVMKTKIPQSIKYREALTERKTVYEKFSKDDKYSLPFIELTLEVLNAAK